MVAHEMSDRSSPDVYHEVETDFNMTAGRYIATRIPTLAPPKGVKLENPFKLLGLLNTKQWLFFFVAFAGWTWDAFDYFTVSLTVADLAKSFDVDTKAITWGITLVLMMRSVGAVTFGLAADRYGRRWPFVVNLIMFVVLELATGFAQTYKQFLGIRAVYGIAMGGIYGMCAATALEDCPQAAKGIVSGMLQQGYALGYLLATAISRGLVDTTSHGWRPLYWFGAAPPVLIIIFRLCLPETEAFIERQKIRNSTGSAGSTFLAEGRIALKHHWKRLGYMVLLMAGFNFMSHGSQDLYPTMLENQFGHSRNAVTVIQCVANMGAILGGTVVGYVSQKFGRRTSIIVISILGGCLLYPYTFTSSSAVIAAAFFEQFCVQGAWGVIPIHLMELAPGSLRTFAVGTSYQLGNLASSASSTIEATIGEQFPLSPLFNKKTGKYTKRYNYGKVICIFLGCTYAYVIALTLLGPENRGQNFDAIHDDVLKEAANVDFDVDAVVEERGYPTGAVAGGSDSENGEKGRAHGDIYAEKGNTAIYREQAV